MTDKQMWKAYQNVNPAAGEKYDAWAFGCVPDALAALVLEGTKTATASAYPCFEKENQPLPTVGMYNVILSAAGEALCITKNTRVTVVPFSEVTAAHAYKEGEDDRSLAMWRTVHQAVFTKELEAYGMQFTPDMPVVCEEFTVVYR